MQDHQGERVLLDGQLMDSKQAAELLRCTEAALALWRRKETGPSFVRMGRLVRYRKQDLLSWIEEQIVSQPPGSKKSAA